MRKQVPENSRKSKKSKARRALQRPRRGHDRVFALISWKFSTFAFPGTSYLYTSISSSRLLSTSFSLPPFLSLSLSLFLATTLYPHDTNWQDQTDLLIKPVPHLRHCLSSSFPSLSIYILEGSLVDLRRQDKKGCRQLFRSSISIFPLASPFE